MAACSADADEILTGRAGLLGVGTGGANLGRRLDTAVVHPRWLVRADVVARR